MSQPELVEGEAILDGAESVPVDTAESLSVVDGVIVPPVKKKERKPRPDISTTTLFIRNIPFDCENGEFEAFFSDFGPLKGCFVVKDPVEEGRCRGIGFVHFALPEDAIKTVKALSEGATKFRGRLLKADWAHKKNIELSASGLTAVVDKGTIVSPVSVMPKSVLVEAERMQECTKLVLLLENDMLADPKLLKALLQRLRRFAPIKGHECPYLEDSHKVLIEYSMPKANYMVYRKLFSKLDTCLLNGATEQTEDVKTEKKKLLSNRTCVLKGIEPVLPEPIKAFRLIIRNLPFNIIRDTQLTEYFSPFGEILEMNIPTVRNESQRHGDSDAFRGRGFAFIQYSKRSEAEKAMEALNGSIVKTRAIAVDWALAKNVYDKLENGNKEVVNEEANEVNEEANEVNEEANEVNEEESSEVEGESGSDLSVTSENIEELVDVDHMEGDDSQSSTIFIRNLSFDTEEESLEEYFVSKIPGAAVEYCKIVRNADTGASRGTAFIKFKDSRSASEAIEIGSRVSSAMPPSQLADLAEKRTRKGFQSIVSDPDALMGDQAGGFLLNGRLLSVSLAVDRKEATDLGRRRALDKISSLLNEEGRDRILDELFAVAIGSVKSPVAASIPRLKRNLALINESVPAADDSDLAAAEVRARESVIQSRARSSANNPNLMLSSTRLAVHHLPPRVTEAQLKEVIYAGVRDARLEAAKPGNPLKLSKKMLALLPQFEGVSKIHSGIHQLKIIQHRSKKTTGTVAEEAEKSAKSRGYGFVEWRHPLLALLCVRWFRRSSAWSQSGISQLIKSRARALARDFAHDPEAQISVPVVEFATEKLNVMAGKRSAPRGGGPKHSKTSKR